MDEVITDLYITDIDTARTTELGADHVVTVCQDSIGDNVGCEYSHFELSDGDTHGYGGRCTYSIYASSVDRVLSAYIDGETVVVHCHRGRSRSPAVCVGAIGVLKRLPYSKSFSIVSSARSAHIDSQLAEFARRYLETHLD